MKTPWVLVTSNENKWREAQAILGHPLERIALELPEIQASTTAEVALQKAKAAYEQVGRPVIVEDAGIELAALGGFPGPFIKFWEQLGGLDSICWAADGLKDRRVVAVCVLGMCSGEGASAVEGRVSGMISDKPRGNPRLRLGRGFHPRRREPDLRRDVRGRERHPLTSSPCVGAARRKSLGNHR